jgi:V/A-type H+-transporting ATPase subunit F
MRFLCIGDDDTCLGFRLAGVETVPVTTAEQAADALRRARQRSDLQIVILSERVAESIRDLVSSIRIEARRPLLVEVPDAAGPMEGRKALLQVIAEAVGLKV